MSKPKRARGIGFLNDGLIPITAVTTFGVNDKPATRSPIGYFGTGLKYAIAVLCREKCPVQFWIGPTKYSFIAKKVKFRTKEINQVFMVREEFQFGSVFKRRQIELPFTTDLGKNWSLWQAFRELESNCRDENGTSYLLDENPLHHTSSQTKIIVYGEKFVSEWLQRDKTFLVDGEFEQTTKDGVQIIERPSEHVYYRGLRIMDLERPSKMTYNILEEIQLTEDRTCANEWAVKRLIAETITQSKDQKLVEKIITAPAETFEGGLGYDYIYSAPSPQFAAASRAVEPSPNVKDTILRHVDSFTKKVVPPSPIDRHPRPWTVEEQVIIDANGKVPSLDAIQVMLNEFNERHPSPMEPVAAAPTLEDF